MIKVSGVPPKADQGIEMAEVRKQMTDLRFRFSVIHRAPRNAKRETRNSYPDTPGPDLDLYVPCKRDFLTIESHD